MGISQVDFENIVYSVANERPSWSVEIDGTYVSLTYRTNRHTRTKHFDYNDNGKITGFCKTDIGGYPGDIQPDMFANMVGDRIDRFLNG
jgi:hypothetical protein